ncbi:MAG: GNAT family N-acetyltransferase [Pirellulales bacterium]
MSSAVLERYVISKPYFDPSGLIVAGDGQRVLGFAHAGFGPSDDESTLSTTNGITCMVMLRPEIEAGVAGELLARSEAYLRSRGATRLLGGGSYPLAPFYFGIYGGSEPSGVLDSDAALQAHFRNAGYRELHKSLVLRRDLAQFRPAIDRQQMQIRRQTSFEMVNDPPTSTWWEACTFEPFERTLCYLQPRGGGAASARVYFWNMETMLGAWGVRAAGIADLEVPAERQRQGLARFLLGEAFRHLHTQGASIAEVHVPEENTPARAVFSSLGFEQVDQAVQFVKE